MSKLNMYSAQYVNCASVILFKKQMALEAATVVTLGRWGQILQAIWGGILGHY